MTPTLLLPWQHAWLQSLIVKNQISPLANFKSGTEGLAWNTHGSHYCLTSPHKIVVSGRSFCLGSLVLIKTGPTA